MSNLIAQNLGHFLIFIQVVLLGSKGHRKHFLQINFAGKSGID